MEIRLEISHGQTNVRNITLGPDSTIGRSSSCNLRIAASVVSRRHCQIRVDGPDVFLRDLNSSNGTFIDGQRIPTEEDVSLPTGCELSIGGIVFTVRYDPAVPVVPLHESTVEIPHLDDTLPNDQEKLQAEASSEIEPATNTPEPIRAADKSADDGAMDRDTDYDPAAASDDTELAEPTESAASGEPVDQVEDLLAETATRSDAAEEIGFGFLEEAETNSSAEPGSSPDDDSDLGDFLNQF